MCGNHLQGDSIFDRIAVRGFEIDTRFSAFATLASFPARTGRPRLRQAPRGAAVTVERDFCRFRRGQIDRWRDMVLRRLRRRAVARQYEGADPEPEFVFRCHGRLASKRKNIFVMPGP
jgi:hypothetical protein